MWSTVSKPRSRTSSRMRSATPLSRSQTKRSSNSTSSLPPGSARRRRPRNTSTEPGTSSSVSVLRSAADGLLVERAIASKRGPSCEASPQHPRARIAAAATCEFGSSTYSRRTGAAPGSQSCPSSRDSAPLGRSRSASNHRRTSSTGARPSQRSGSGSGELLIARSEARGRGGRRAARRSVDRVNSGTLLDSSAPTVCHTSPQVKDLSRRDCTGPSAFDSHHLHCPAPAFAQVRQHQGRHTARHGWRPSCVWADRGAAAAGASCRRSPTFPRVDVRRHGANVEVR